MKIVVVLLLARRRQNLNFVKKNFAVIFTKNVPRGTPRPNANENHSQHARKKIPARGRYFLARFVLGYRSQLVIKR